MYEQEEEGPVMLLAVCEGTSLAERVLGIGIAFGAIVFWVALTWLVVWQDRLPEERWSLLAILVVAGGLVTVVLTGLHDGLETLVIPALAVALVVGAAGGLLLRVGIPRGVAAALTGGIALPIFIFAIFLFVAFLGGTCLGEELG